MSDWRTGLHILKAPRWHTVREAFALLPLPVPYGEFFFTIEHGAAGEGRARVLPNLDFWSGSCT